MHPNISQAPFPLVDFYWSLENATRGQGRDNQAGLKEVCLGAATLSGSLDPQSLRPMLSTGVFLHFMGPAI